MVWVVGLRRASLLSGAPLYVILAAGEWSSPAFLEYMDVHRLETEAVVQAHVENSEADDEGV